MADTTTTAPKYKYVRFVGPGGATLNFVGMTGNSHYAYPVAVTLIKKALERGILCFELLKPASDADAEEKYKELTLENYATDNGGKVVDKTAVTVIPDIEDQRADMYATLKKEKEEAVGKEFKEYFDKVAAEIAASAGSSTSSSSTGDSSSTSTSGSSSTTESGTGSTEGSGSKG